MSNKKFNENMIFYLNRRYGIKKSQLKDTSDDMLRLIDWHLEKRENSLANIIDKAVEAYDAEEFCARTITSPSLSEVGQQMYAKAMEELFDAIDADDLQLN